MERKTLSRRFADWLITRWAEPGVVEEFLGDLDELYNDHREQKGVFVAETMYIVNAVHLLFAFYSKSSKQKKHNTMFPRMIKHNFKFILRTLWARRLYTSVIMLSLIVGFVCANILVSFLVFETNTDTFHSKRERTFQLFSNDPFGGSGLIAYMPSQLHDYLTSNYGEVENACLLSDIDKITIETTEQKFENLTILSVDSSFFDLFDFSLIQGNKTHAFAPDKIVLSKDKALAMFGKADVVGNFLAVSTSDTVQQLMISAVVDKPIENSHLIFDALIHHSVFPKKWNGGAGYVLLKNQGASASLLAKMNVDPNRPGLIGKGQMEYFFEPLTNSYFSTNNKMSYMKTRNPMFVTVGYIVCGLVLCIASFNFINLFLLSWHNRKKEVGIKKTLGIGRHELFSLSLVEAGVYVFSAYLVSLIITFYALPVFNTVFETSLSPTYLLNIKVVTIVCVILFLIGALVVILSVSKQWSMKPISLMAKDSSRVRFNRFLFTIQFVISITLTICCVTIIQQMSYIENAPLGFNRHIVQVNAPDKKSAPSLEVLKQKVMQLPGISHVSVGNGNPIFSVMMARYDLPDKQFYSPYLFGGDEDYLKTLDLKLIEGELPSEKNNGKLVNEELVRQFEMKEPLGELVPGTQDKIVGVVKDFTCGSFKQEIPPVIISYHTSGMSLLVDYAGADLSPILPQIEAHWKQVFPDHQFKIRVLQEELMKKYKDDTFFYKIVITFSVISMILSCFGLFALSWAVIQSRTKEMGIRKVLGATALDVLNLLTLTFTKRIIVAFVIAVPVGYYLMDQWLTRFVNRIELNPWIFLISAFMVIIVAALTLGSQTVKATMTNPVDELRNE